MRLIYRNCNAVLATVAALLALWLAAPASAAVIAGDAVRIVDGDTFVLRVDTADGVKRKRQRQRRIRLVAIDSPERSQAFYRAATERLDALLRDRRVVVESSGRDRHGRSVGKVTVAGNDAGLAMVGAGLAWFASRYADELTPADAARYAAAERGARQRRVGLWAAANPQPPWRFRKANPGLYAPAGHGSRSAGRAA